MTKAEAAARDGIPEPLRPIFDAMVSDYRFVCEKRYARAWAVREHWQRGHFDYVPSESSREAT